MKKSVECAVITRDKESLLDWGWNFSSL